MEFWGWFCKSLTDDIRALHRDCIAELRLNEFYGSLIITNDIESMYVPGE